MKKTAYRNLPFLPALVAEIVCSEEYKGQERDKGRTSIKFREDIEAKRKAMTAGQISEFSSLADTLCEKAFIAEAAWFMKIVEAKGCEGIDLLYVWIRHWMTSYLTDPKKLARDISS